MNCPICRAQRVELYHAWPDFRVMTCRECGFRFTDLETWQYPYLDKDYYDIGEISEPNPYRPFLFRRASQILRHCRSGRALDVGCGMGEMPLLLSEHGFSATGLDESRKTIDFLRSRFPKVGWESGAVLDLIPTLGRFDVVTMYHVLEHIPHPVEVMKGMKDILRPGGYIVIEVPNMGGLNARLMGRGWHYYLRHHVNYFKGSHLKMLADAIGCKTLEIAGYYDFTYPIGARWKIAVKNVLRAAGFQDVVSIVMQCAD